MSGCANYETADILLYKAIAIGGAFFLFAGIAMVAWVFFFACLPQTRGRTLEDMQVLFGNFIKWRSALKDEQKKEVSGENDGQMQMGTKG